MNQNIIADRYILEEIIGEGSYSIVYQGYDQQDKKIVAIKEMKSIGLSQEEAQDIQQIFFNEINILKKLNHECLPKIYDFFIFNGRHYMVMEWCRGKNLFELMNEKEDNVFQEKEALLVMRQVCDILIYLQNDTRLIIYKDLKPSNIIIDDNNKVRLIDFGTARQYSPKKDKDTMVLGTPGYAPIEAYTGVQSDLSADIYSFGATFYHILTGKEPFQFQFNFPDPRTYNKMISSEVSSLLLDCLKNREKRIKNAFILRKKVYKIKIKINSDKYSNSKKNSIMNFNYLSILYITMIMTGIIILIQLLRDLLLYLLF